MTSDTDPMDAPEDQAFREEVRAFFAAVFDGEMRALAARRTGLYAEGELRVRLHRALYEKGWIAPHWPEEYGGPGWTARQREIYAIETTRIGVPGLPGLGLRLCAPVLMKCGTEEQKAYFLPRILSNECYFCQGYSEPNAGSDLASLQTRAVRDGDDYVVDGSKIWTTHAHYANWMFMLVRTSTEGKKQDGISFLLTPMDAPGITVRPLVSISGDHEFNQVFFEGVRVPVKNRVGAENEGWTVAKYLLEHERGGAQIGPGLTVGAERVRSIAADESDGYGNDLLHDRDFRRKLALLELDAQAAHALDLRLSAGGDSAAQSVGPAGASLKKMLASEKGQVAAELSMEALGPYRAASQREFLDGREQDPIGPEHAGALTARYLNSRASTIFGGSNEIQHNILARILGL